jgi:NAD(P)H-flavin reductase
MTATIALPPPLPAAEEPMLPRRAIVRAIKPEAYGISTFTLEMADRSHFSFRAGQFNMLYLPPFGESAISMSSAPGDVSQFDHTIRFAGNVTRAIGRLQPGAEIGVRGPFGRSWPIEQARGRDLLLVTGGIGLAPLRPVVLDVIRRRSDFRRVLLLYGARTPADLLYTAELPEWEAAGIEILVTVDRADLEWKGQVGVVPVLFYRVRLDPKSTIVFTCGPEVMMRFVVYEAIARRIQPDAIWVSLERNMKCAVGFCGHCQMGPLFICRDGPVLPFATVAPLFNHEEF